MDKESKKVLNLLIEIHGTENIQAFNRLYYEKKKDSPETHKRAFGSLLFNNYINGQLLYSELVDENRQLREQLRNMGLMVL